MTNGKFETIAVIGLGYIGLPTAATFATRGIRVIGVDTNPKAVETINRGEIHIIEPDLDIIVRAAVQTGSLRAALKPEPADAFIIAVPTPLRNGREPDLSYIEAAVRAIAPVLTAGNLVILESTSPVGTTEKLSEWFSELRPDLKFPKYGGDETDVHIAHCPERVLPGRVVYELIQNDRIIGGVTSECGRLSATLYKSFVRGECILTDSRTAEMCKLVENAFRDVNIAYANELSLICEKLGVNVWELIKLANRHPRVQILNPGPGVGGHCIAVDPWFLVNSAPQEAKLIATARTVNDGKPGHVVDQVAEVAVKFRDPVIACLGLAFKADIDDLRESPAVEIVKHLADRSIGRLLAVEPNIVKLPKDLEGIATLTDLESALTQADVILLLVDHRQFRNLDADRLQKYVVVDTRGIWSTKRSVSFNV